MQRQTQPVTRETLLEEANKIMSEHEDLDRKSVV